MHIFPESIFLEYFIEFLKKHFVLNDHIFITLGNGSSSSSDEYLDSINDFKSINFNKKNFRDILKFLDTSDLIILHSIAMRRFSIIYFIILLYPYFIKKTVWVIWGYDLYDIVAKERSYKRSLYFILKKMLVRKIPYVVARSPDYKRLQKWYGSYAIRISIEPLYSGGYYEVAPRHSRDNASQSFNIILGNSANEENRHLDVLEFLSKYKDDNIKIHIPLSYGDAKYAEIVKIKARSVFGEKVVFLETFMPPEEYRKYLTQMDIGIFNNNRQQALGNLAYLFATGAKIYINEDSPLWELFAELNFAVHPISNLGEICYEEFVDLDRNELDANSQKAREIYSEEHGVMCWNEVFALANSELISKLY